MTLGHTGFHGTWSKQTVDDLRANGKTIGVKQYPVKQIAPLVLKALPILKDWPSQTVSGFDLMYKESEAVIGTMLELIHEHDCPSLSVHDSIIVPIRRMEDACSILQSRYKEVSGITPSLRVNKAKQT
jgi:hypothetical protein